MAFLQDFLNSDSSQVLVLLLAIIAFFIFKWNNRIKELDEIKEEKNKADMKLATDVDLQSKIIRLNQEITNIVPLIDAKVDEKINMLNGKINQLPMEINMLLQEQSISIDNTIKANNRIISNQLESVQNRLMQISNANKEHKILIQAAPEEFIKTLLEKYHYPTITKYSEELQVKIERLDWIRKLEDQYSRNKMKRSAY